MATENDFGTDALGSRPTTSPVRTSLTCAYIYPSKDEQRDARVESWVAAARAELDPVVWRAVSNWLATAWPFKNPEYAPRP